MASESKSGFSLAALLVMIGVLLLFFFVLVPFLRHAVTAAGGDATGTRGKDIFVAITAANTEREPLGLTNVWPRTHIDGIQANGNNAEALDIADMVFQNSTDYFNTLFDGANYGTTNWAPYVIRIDHSTFAGAGVPRGDETKKLQPENNMWCIAADIQDEMDDAIPLLVTRNVDCGSFHKIVQSDGKETLQFSTQYKTPYSNKGFIMLRKGGNVYKARVKHLNEIFYSSKSSCPMTIDDVPPAYLTPDSLVTAPQN
jgi:hypothetical protein